MSLVKIALNSYVQASEIKLITVYEGRGIINHIKELRKTNKVVDLTKGKKTLCVIFLMDGTAILINSAPETITKRIEEGESDAS